MTRIKKDLAKKDLEVDMIETITESIGISESIPEEIDEQDEKSVDRAMYFFNRELSWIAFNKRVLSEGIDSRTSLLERAKFFAIFSTNLDEFFMVRVARVKKKLSLMMDLVQKSSCK